MPSTRVRHPPELCLYERRTSLKWCRLRIEVADHIVNDSGLRDAWNQLVLQMEPPEVFYTFEWAMAVQQAYSSSLKPVIFFGYEDEVLVAVVALAQRSNREIAFLSADTADYCDFVSDSARRDAFVSAVISELKSRGVSRVVLTNLPEDSPSLDALSRVGSGTAYHLHRRPAYECAQVVLGSNDHRLSLKQSLLGKKSRRRMREMQKFGEITILHETDPDKIQALLEPFSHAHVARFLEIEKISSLLRAERRNFLREFTQTAGPHGWVVMSRLLVGGVTAAWHFGFRFEGTWFWYQPTVNALYADYSPGHFLLSKIIELACDSAQLDTVDLGLGAEGYKDRFATNTRRTLYFVLTDSLGQHVREIVRYRASAVATSSARAERAIRGMISSARTIQSKLRTLAARQIARQALRWLKQHVSSCENVRFFEWPAASESSHIRGFNLVALNPEFIGAAAIRHADNPDATQYLARSAQRLASRHADGFVLLDAQGAPAHFCWVAAFEGFAMPELSRKLEAPSKQSVVIFDCYTLGDVPGPGDFSRAITLLAQRLSSEGKHVWISVADANQEVLGGIRKTNFIHRFTVGQKTRFFIKKKHESVSNELLSNSVSKPISTEHTKA